VDGVYIGETRDAASARSDDSRFAEASQKFRADDPFSHSFPRYLVRGDER